MGVAVERRFDPTQLRDDHGRWSDGPGGAVSYTLDAFEDLYGAIVDDRYAGDLYVSVHDGGEFVLSEVDETGRRTVLLDDLTSNSGRRLADDVEWAGEADIPDDAESDAHVRLIDWHTTDDGVVVGYDPSGEVSVRFPRRDDAKPRNLHDYDIQDLSGGDARDLVEALRDMADAREDLDVERSATRARLRALANQIQRKFNPNQLRDPGGEHGGQWVKSPGEAAEAAGKDLLKLAGKIDLERDEQLLASAKLDSGAGGVRMALTERAGKRMLRFGVGGEGYGKRDRDEGTPAWDGNPSRAPLSDHERKRLDQEQADLDAEYDSASPARQAEIDNRLADIREQLTAGDLGFNQTAQLDEYSTRRLIDRIRPALDEAVDQEKAQNAAWDEIDALEAKGNPDPARMANLRENARADSDQPIVFVEGIVPGSAWGDVHFQVELDDLSVGPQVVLGVQPKGAPDDWGDDKDWQGKFDIAETRRLLKLLDKFTPTSARSQVSRMYTGDSGDTRSPATSAPKGGQFAPGGGRVGGKGKPGGKGRPAAKRPAGHSAGPAKPAGPLGYDGRTGAGYGIKGGDARVRTLQSVLNRFELRDSSGQPLAVDGKFGPRTTAAVKRLQKAMGEEPTGKVTEDFIKRIENAKSLQELRPPKPAPKPRKRMRRSIEEHPLDNGICRTCQPSDKHVLVNGICQTCA